VKLPATSCAGLLLELDTLEAMEPTVFNILRRRWHDTRLRCSRFAALREIGADFWEFLKESTPERRRALFGDLEYDWDHQVNTTSGAVSPRTRLLAALAGAPYQPTEPSLFSEMLDALAIDFARFTFIDIGSGKGRTLLMAAERPFERIIGVELLPELHQVALENIAKSSEASRLESVCVDARDYVFPPDPLVVYLFNPLPASALEQMIAHLESSLHKCPRPVRAIYHNPVSGDVLDNAAFLEKLTSTHQYAIYST
jgi:SAM-dependent methyltransferase